MYQEVFYENLTRTLQSFNYYHEPEIESLSKLNKTRDIGVKNLAKGIEIVGNIAGGGTGFSHWNYKDDDFKRDIKMFYGVSDHIYFKFQITQPIIVVAVDGDQLTSQQCIEKFKKFDEMIIQMKKHSGRQYFLVKLGVTGIMLFVFKDSEKAKQFDAHTKAACKASHLIKKTYSMSWTCDIANRSVSPHSGLPFLVGILSKDKLQQSLFS